MTLIKNKEIMSFLAVNDHGQTAGHFLLAFSDLYKNMPEVSTVVVKKEFRGLGLFAKFMDYCDEIGKEHGFRALMGQPVTFHPMSQKAFLRAGYTATSLLMSYINPEIESEYNKDGERLGLSVSVKMLDEDAFREHIEKTLKVAKGCNVEITQRDVYTVNKDINKVKRYVEIIRESIENCW